ncbi:MAG: NCS2 family permease [Candidatus Izemoplasmatales bacterium]
MDKVKKGLNSFFKIEERGSTITKELLGGLTIFLAMVYILPVNAGILSTGTGLTFGSVFAATAIAAGVASILMGLLANYPIALASGMGVNAFFTYTVVLTLGFSAYEALAATFISGVLFLIVSLTGLRKTVINAIPKNLKLAIGAGIGFFIAFIGLKNGGIIVDHGVTFVTLGDLSHPTVLLALFGILLGFGFMAYNKKITSFAIILSIVITGLVGVLLGLIFPSLADVMPGLTNENAGSISDMGDVFGKAITSIPDLLSKPMAYAVIFTFLFIDFFDTSGTLVAVGHDANLFDANGELINGEKALVADATGTIVGSIFGTSTVTSFIESSTGIKQGARTGLSATVVGVLFLLSLLIYPAFGFVGDVNGLSPVTAVALVYVGALMISSLKEIDWNDHVIVPVTFITVMIMLLAYSIHDGIAFGFIFYTLMMLIAGRKKELNLTIYILAALFVINYFIYFVIIL